VSQDRERQHLCPRCLCDSGELTGAGAVPGAVPSVHERASTVGYPASLAAVASPARHDAIATGRGHTLAGGWGSVLGSLNDYSGNTQPQQQAWFAPLSIGVLPGGSSAPTWARTGPTAAPFVSLRAHGRRDGDADGERKQPPPPTLMGTSRLARGDMGLANFSGIVSSDPAVSGDTSSALSPAGTLPQASFFLRGTTKPRATDAAAGLGTTGIVGSGKVRGGAIPASLYDGIVG
jgi:hypothetical protein